MITDEKINSLLPDNKWKEAMEKLASWSKTPEGKAHLEKLAQEIEKIVERTRQQEKSSAEILK
jgi:hypothetical protein